MATAGRRNRPDLIAQLRANPTRFRFFQAVRLLSLAEKAAGREADLPKKLRFRTSASLSFPPSEILRFEPEQKVEPDEQNSLGPLDEMEVSFLGLTGPSGVLPSHYTELIMDRKFLFRDSSAHAFFDIFNHRMLVLFYSAWQKYRFYVNYEAGRRDGFTGHLLDLLGTGRPALKDLEAADRLPQDGSIPPQILAYFAGALGRRPLPASSLLSMIRSYFGVKAELRQFVGQWIVAPCEEQSSLGQGCCALGVDTVVGERVWDQQTKIGLSIGPLDHAQFCAFQAGQPAAQTLRKLVELSVGQTLNCDVTLVLEREAVTDMPMSSRAPVPLRLGQNTWLRTRSLQHDLEDVSYKLL